MGRRVSSLIGSGRSKQKIERFQKNVRSNHPIVVKRKLTSILLLLLLVIFIAFYITGEMPGQLPFCGDGICDTSTEDCASCPQDCGACSNGDVDVCTVSCPAGYMQEEYPDCSCSLIPKPFIPGPILDSTVYASLYAAYVVTSLGGVPNAHLISSLDSNVTPSADDTYSFGNTTNRWSNVYAPIGRSSTFLVAANDSSAKMKAQADYICDGVDDHIQILAAIAALPSGGGTVMLSEGEFSLRGGLALTSNVVLRGTGSSTVLKSVAAAQVPLSANGITGNSFVDVATPGSFAVGMGIDIADDLGVGTFGYQAVITDITGNRITFAGYTLNRDYTMANNAYAINAFSPVFANLSYKNVLIENLKVDGNRANVNIDFSNLGRGLTLNSHYSSVYNSIIEESIGDGIIINGDYCKVSGNLVNGSNGLGVHLSGGTRGTQVMKNTIIRHDLYGLYYCANIVESIVTGNVIRNNSYGVGGFGANDEMNILTSNDISHNDLAGLINTIPRTFDNFIITNNIIMNNGQQPTLSNYNVHFYGAISQLIFTDNIIGDDQVVQTVYGNIRWHSGCSVTDSVIEGNILFGATDDVFNNEAAPMMEGSKWDHYPDIRAESTTYVGSWVGTGVQQIITTGITNPDVPRNLLVTCTNVAAPSGDVFIYGSNSRGVGIAETATIAAGSTVTLDNPFATVTQIIIPATVTGADTVTIGIGSDLGLSRYIRATSDVFKVKKNNAHMSSVNYTVNATYHTVNVSTGAAIVAGDNFTIYYKQNLNILSS